MLKRLGIESRMQLTVFLAFALLVAITPLGQEATHPIVLGIYRTLLFVICFCVFTSPDRPASRLSPQFLVTLGAGIALMAASAAFAGKSGFEGAYGFYRHALFIVAFIGLARFQSVRSIEWKRSALVLVVGVNLFYLAYAFLKETRPLVGPFANPNYFASFLLPGIAVCVAWAVWGAGAKYRVAALAAGLILYFGIVRAYSRGATLAALGILLVAGLRFARQKGVSPVRLTALGLLILTITVAANPPLIQKFLDRGQNDPYNYLRPKIWMGAVNMIADHPLLGVGAGRYHRVATQYSPAVEGTIARYGRWPDIAHSEYLHFAAENGAPAALALLAAGLFLFAGLWKRAENLTGEPRIVQEAALLSAVGLCAHAAVDNNWTVPVLAAGMAVISQADLLPFADRQAPRWSLQQMRLSARVLAAAAIGMVFVQAVLIPGAALYFNEAGHRAYTADQFQRAELMHRIAAGIAPDHPVLQDNLGMVYFDEFLRSRNADHLDQAETAFRNAIAADPDLETAGNHLERALIQRLTGNPEQDREIHARIIDIDRSLLRINPFNPFVRKNLAEALYNSGAAKEAADELRRAIQIEPNYVPAYLRLAEWCASDGVDVQCERFVEQAVSVVNRYRDNTTLPVYEAVLLGRPADAFATR